MMPASADIFPDSEDEEPERYESINTHIDAFTNYPGIDTDSLEIEEIQSHIDTGHLFAPNSFD